MFTSVSPYRKDFPSLNRVPQLKPPFIQPADFLKYFFLLYILQSDVFIMY
jgi:hypothetical protein